MKLKFPKKITIGDREWNIKTDKTTNGGSFSYIKCEIIIGTKELRENPIRTLNVIIHELKEILHVEQDTRFPYYNNESDYLFNYGHREHTELCANLAGLLNNFIK